jgi:SAM-dependent methyltransferase
MPEASDVFARCQTIGTIPNERSEPITSALGVCLLCSGTLKLSEEGLFDTRFGIPGKYEVWRCLGCGLEQLYPIPEPSILKALYESHYNFGGETGTLYTKAREKFLFSTLNHLWTRLDGDISFYLRRGSGRLLDIGCNEGRGLRVYASNGFQVEGLELNEAAASVARRAGFVVHTEPLEDFNPEVPFDVAVMSNVLEHSVDPRRMLLDVSRVLTTGGRLWMSCPNSRSWLRSVFGKSWINWHVPFHISHFSAETLPRLLAEAGYVNIELRQITPALWVTQSIIAWVFSREGKKTRQLRNPFLTFLLLVLARFLFFSAFWIGNKLGRGDCLLASATKT